MCQYEHRTRQTGHVILDLYLQDHFGTCLGERASANVQPCIAGTIKGTLPVFAVPHDANTLFIILIYLHYTIPETHKSFCLYRIGYNYSYTTMFMYTEFKRVAITTIKDTCIFQNQFLFQIRFIKIKSTKICLCQFS